jgi:hypothetical protein
MYQYDNVTFNCLLFQILKSFDTLVATPNVFEARTSRDRVPVATRNERNPACGYLRPLTMNIVAAFDQTSALATQSSLTARVVECAWLSP